MAYQIVVRTTKVFDWITIAGAIVSVPVALYMYSFEYLVGAVLLTLQTARLIAFQRFCEELESELEHAEEYLGH